MFLQQRIRHLGFKTSALFSSLTEVHQYGDSILGSIKLFKIFWQISEIWVNARLFTWISVFSINISYNIQFLDFIDWIVFELFSCGIFNTLSWYLYLFIILYMRAKGLSRGLYLTTCNQVRRLGFTRERVRGPWKRSARGWVFLRGRHYNDYSCRLLLFAKFRLAFEIRIHPKVFIIGLNA